MNIVADSMLARLKRLPLRLRLAHLAALLRHERQAITRTCSYPSPRGAEARVGGLFSAPPTPLLISFASTLPTAPRGEGLSADLAKPTFTDGGRAG
jgi:hypothetical protein